MEKVWDNSLSTLINSNPQAFLDLILPGARCLHQHRTKLKGTQRQPDVVLEVERYDEIFLVNPEIQSYRDPKMAERLLLYHVLLWMEHDGLEHDKPLSVRSYVISLFKQAKVARSPLRWLLPGEPPGLKKERLSFRYKRIELWKKRPEEILNLGHVELYPLLPLTKGGATREIVNRMLELLSGEQHHIFALIGFTFATFMFHKLKRNKDLEWLEKRFRHMHDILRESPVYQWILTEGREEEKAQGLAQARQAVMDFVQEHFPALAQLAEEVVATIDNLAQLVRLTGNLGSAQSVEQARQILLDARQ